MSISTNRRRRRRRRREKKYRKLIDLIKEELEDEVKDVRLSGRLKDSACLLVGEEGGINPQMERIMKAMGQNVPDNKRILEINGDHPLFAAMNGLFEKDKESPVLHRYARLLYDQALLIEGSRPKDPAAFATAVADLMTEGLKTA